MALRLRALLGLACVLALGPSAACDGADPPPPVDLRGSDVSVHVGLDPFAITIVDARGRDVLRTVAGGDGDPYGTPGATRDDGPDNVSAIAGWDGYVPDERAWTHPHVGKLVGQTDTSASFELAGGSGAILIEIAIEGAKVTIGMTARSTDPAWNKTGLAFALRPDEHFFGLGERFASVDHRGLSMYSWAEEGGLGRGEGAARESDNPFPNGPSMTYFPIPFFLSSEGYAIHLATSFRTETHFGSERPDAWRVAANTTSFQTVVYVHDDPLASLDDFTRETGRPMVPAPWVFGPVRRVGHDSKVGDVDEYKMLRLKRVPTTTVDDATHFLPMQSQIGREELLKTWTKSAHAWGYKVMAYNNAHVALERAEAKADVDYGTEHGLFARTPEGTIAETSFVSGELLSVATIDLTKPEAVLWFQDMLKRTLALGYDGWMHDFGEYVRRPWLFGDGRRGDEVHNVFPVLSAKAAHDVLEKERPGDYLFYVRSGYTGSAQYVPAVWSGDPEATFDTTQGIPAMLRGGLNLGMSGVALWGSDLTGFKCMTDFPHDKEMYLRWAEVAAVSPFMLEENACANPLGRREKWKLWNDDETVAVYGAMARLHTRLAPYWDVLAREAHATGIPIMRHPFLLHPREPEAWAVESSFYLGPSLFASPVVERGARAKETWLPPGKWVDFDDQTVYEGARRITIPAPLGKLPLLLRDGGIVPLLDASIESLAPATEAGVVTPDKVADRLDVVVALSAGRDAKIILADGTSIVVRRSVGGAAVSGLAEVPAEEVATCAGKSPTEGCVSSASTSGIHGRIRLTTPLIAAYAAAHGDLAIDVAGALPRRVRFDIIRVH